MIRGPFDVREMDKHLFKQCYSLNLRDYGTMQWKLGQARRGNVEGCVWVIPRTILGSALDAWCLVADHHTTGKCAYFYVRATKRGLGLGRVLRTAVLDSYPDAHVYKWDTASTAFFADHFPNIHDWT